MAIEPTRLEWQVMGSWRRIRPRSWLLVILASATTGVVLAQWQPIAALISAIERNGVPTQQASRRTERTTASPTQLMDAVVKRPVVAPRVVLLNPGVVKKEPQVALRSRPKALKRTNVATRMSRGASLAMRIFGGNSVN